MTNVPCSYSGDHTFRYGGSCSSCGHRLRCGCGRFVTIEDLDAHLKRDCPQTRNVPDRRRPVTDIEGHDTTTDRLAKIKDEWGDTGEPDLDWLIAEVERLRALPIHPGGPAPVVLAADGRMWTMTEWAAQIEEGTRRTRNDS